MKAYVFMAALLAAAIGGCGSDEKLDDLVGRIANLEQTLGSLEQSVENLQPRSAKPSLAAVSERLQEQDFTGAYDCLLSAMQLSPGEPEVFTAAMAFVDAAAKSGGDEALELASDIYLRTDRLIPFLPVAEMASARERWLEVDVSEPSAPEPAPHPVDALLADLQELAAADLPAQPTSLALQRLRGELESLAVSAALDAEEEGFWDRWKEAEAEIERAETDVLVQLYGEQRPQYDAWLEQRASALDEYSKAKTDGLNALSKRFGEIVQQGYRLRSELSPFVEAGVADAVRDQKELDEHLELLERARDWMHNQHALALLDYLQNRSDAEPLEKLKRLARCDEQRFSPYVLQRFQEQWEHFFEELGSEEQRVEATKARVLQGTKL